LLLKTVRRQSIFLKNLEKEYPGITAVETDDSGTIIIDDDDGEDYGKLLDHIK